MKRIKAKLVAGILVAAIGFILSASGAFILLMNQSLDFEGYYVSEVFHVDTPAYAYVIYVAPLEIGSEWGFLDPDILAQTKWIVTASGKEIFAGWANASDVNDQLTSVRHEFPMNWNWIARPYYAAINITTTAIYNEGAIPPQTGEEAFWITSTQTSTSSTLYWDPTWPESDGTERLKVLVLANTDGSAGVQADIQLGSKTPILCWLWWILLPSGITLIIGGILLFKKRSKSSKKES